MSLRTRVLVGSVLIAVVLAVAAVMIARSTEADLIGQLDAQLATVPGRAPGLAGVRPLPDGAARPAAPPADPAGDVPTAAQLRDARAGAAGAERLSPLYVGLVDEGGAVETVFAPNLTGETPPLPAIDAAAARAAAASGEPFTVGSEGSDLRYRVMAHAVPLTGQVLAVALPMGDVDRAVDRLVAVEVAATGVVLLVLAAVSWWVIRLGVRPIKRMTRTAGAIAAGELSHRVPEGSARTEAGELGIALNRMLGRLERSFDERSRSEERLRRFVADASHELRTPVATIRGYAELYRGGALEQRHDLSEAMRRTEQEAVRMGALIDDMLLLARLDQGRPLERAPVDVAALVDDAARDARAVDPARPITATTDGPLVVLGDADRLRQVVANLVANALVHTPEGTAVELRASATGAAAVVEVADHGDGMSGEDAERAFERFYRADPSRSRHRGGSGLGLAIVHATATALGGTATLVSEPGCGTTVRVELPLAGQSLSTTQP